MIKCDVTVRGAVSRQATLRKSKDGIEFVSFAMNVVLPARQGEDKTIEVQATIDGGVEFAIGLAPGTRVIVHGQLTFKKRGDDLSFRLHADKLQATEDASDAIEGSMEFRGSVGKQIEARTDKKGRNFTSFSAYSTEKNGEDFEFTWVRFIRFAEDELPFLRMKAKIEAKGALELSVFNGRIGIGCRADEVREYVRDANTAQ